MALYHNFCNTANLSVVILAWDIIAIVIFRKCLIKNALLWWNVMGKSQVPLIKNYCIRCVAALVQQLQVFTVCETCHYYFSVYRMGWNVISFVGVQYNSVSYTVF